MQNKMKIDDLIQFILDGMVEQKYSQRTIQNYGRRFNVLKRLSKEIGEQYPTLELLSAFLGDTFKTQTGQPSIMTKRQLIRCINLLTSLMETGNIDWSRRKKEDISALVTEPAFQLLLEKFLVQLKQRGLSRSTICSYKRILSYFFIFCQEKGYKELCDIKSNDVSAFIISLYQKGYFKPTTITSALSGFRQFLSSYDQTKLFLLELPYHLPHARNIIEIYDVQEGMAIKELLSTDALSKRDLAICKLLIETGLRGIDVCELKLADIDWNKDIIRIIQKKTGQALEIPLRSSYGNAIADYILYERPDSDSGYLFLRSLAPFKKLEGAPAVYCILRKMEEKAGIQKKDG